MKLVSIEAQSSTYKPSSFAKNGQQSCSVIPVPNPPPMLRHLVGQTAQKQSRFMTILNIPIYVCLLTEAMAVSIIISCTSWHFVTCKTSSLCLHGKCYCWRVVKGAGCGRLYPSTTYAPKFKLFYSTSRVGSYCEIGNNSCVGIHILGHRC